jgi:hypothetical protein
LVKEFWPPEGPPPAIPEDVWQVPAKPTSLARSGGRKPVGEIKVPVERVRKVPRDIRESLPDVSTAVPVAKVASVPKDVHKPRVIGGTTR